MTDSLLQLPYKNKLLNRKQLGKNVPRRGGIITPFLAGAFLKVAGWKVVGDFTDVPQAVLLAVPHTSNVDGVYALPSVLYSDVKINIMGKKALFKNPIFAKFLTWCGVIPIDRKKKGSVLQASIDEFKKGKPLFVGLAPEGTRGYSEKWKSGFYYLATGAGVPIIPVAMDYKTKEIRFMNVFYPTGNYDKDLQAILAKYKGVVPKCPENLSQPLQDINK
ncbi:MAG: lysophospholipid acyltransferase family protein [Moraxellaceae bacterium]|nr:lysophospholipid acyltransferase family protein [Moraxellaceae bacterium]